MAKKKKAERHENRAIKKELRQDKKALRTGTTAEDLAKMKAADDISPVAEKPIKKREVRKDKRVQKKRLEKSAEETKAAVAAAKIENDNPSNAPSLSEELEKPAPIEAVTSTIDGKDPKGETEKVVIDQSTTFDEAKSGETLGNAVKEEVDTTVEAADNNSKVIKEALTEQATEVVDGEGTRNTEAGYQKYDGDGSALKDVAQNGTGNYGMTDEELQRAGLDHQRRNAAIKASAPAAAIEKMGIEHYYPPKQDFVKSNFTGRYIGSRQIVAATGALYPEGLVDARKRATEAKSKAKAEAEDKYWELTDTAPQYDEDYKDVGMDMLNKYYEASGGDIKGLLTGNSKLAREFQREMYDYKSRGKNLIAVDGTVKELVKTLNTPGEYIPPEIVKTMMDFRSGTKDVDAYLSGETIGDEDMKKMSNTLRSYQNFTPLANKQLELLNSLGADSLPLAAGSDFSDPVFAARASEAMALNKHKDYDQFTKVMGEFYDVGAVETMVREMYASNNLYEGSTDKEYEKRIQDGTQYMMSVLPDKIDIETKMQANKALGWASLAHKRSVWNTKKKWTEKDIESMYHGINREMTEPAFEADMIAAHSSSTDPAKRSAAIAQVFHKYGRTTDNTGGYSSARLPTIGKTVQSVTPSNLQVIGKDGKQRSVSGELGQRWVEYNALKDAGKSEGDPAYDAVMSDIKELNYVKDKGSTPMTINVGSRTVTMSYWDANSGSTIPLESYNGTIDPANLTNTVHLGGQVGIGTGELNDDGTGEVVIPSSYSYVDNNNLENEATIRALAAQEGRAESVGYTKEYYESQGDGFSMGSGGSSTTPQ